MHPPPPPILPAQALHPPPPQKGGEGAAPSPLAGSPRLLSGSHLSWRLPEKRSR